MDVDTEETVQASTSKPTKRFTVPVDDAHPFDLDGYISNYTGRGAVDRLVHIISICPAVAPEALHLAVQHIHQLRDPALYREVLHAYEQATAAAAGARLPGAADIAGLDGKWAEETVARNQAERSKLEVELKTYSNNMIKESIRMAHRDLGDFYRAVGEHGTALKHYTKSREFCTSSQHVLDMCLSVLELLIEEKNYTHLPTYVFKADAALDAATAGAGASSGPTPTVTASTGKKSSPERDKVQSKLDLATALAHMGQGNYEKAALAFLRIGSIKQLGDWAGKIVAPGDIAVYGTLCALATFPRAKAKAAILENAEFGVYIEQEPYVRELVEAYMGSSFKAVLELLSRYSTRHYADIHLAPHVQALENAIRDSAVVLYFKPFASIKLERMSAAFGWTIDEVEQHVVALIQSGDIKGRVDSQNKILQARETDYRAELFARAIKAGQDMESANRKLLLRMRLQQADLVVKAPKSSHASLGSMQLDMLSPEA